MTSRDDWDDLAPTLGPKAVVWLIFLLSATLVLHFGFRRHGTNPASRMATMDALVHDGTFVIDDSPVGRRTIDKVKIDGHFVSSKPPLLSVLGTGVYAAYHWLTGWSFRNEGAGNCVYVVTIAVGLASQALLLLFAFRLAQVWSSNPLTQVVFVWVCAFALLGSGYATTLNNHTPAAALLLGAFYYALAARRQVLPGRRPWVRSGVLGSLAVTIDLGALYGCLGLFAYLATYDAKRTFRLFVMGALPVLALHFLLTYLATGSLAPVYLRPELYLYSGSYWRKPTGYDALNEPWWQYAAHMLVGHHGLLAMTPVLAFALWALGRRLWRRRDPESLLVAGTFVATVVHYIATTKNYGGNCVGFRWLIVVTPLVAAYLIRWLDTPRSRLVTGLFWAALVVSQYTMLDATKNAWKTGEWNQQVNVWGLGSLPAEERGGK